GRLKNILRKRLPKKFWGVVIHGELEVMKNGKILDRQTGNGILNSCLSNTADQKDADCVILKIWDAVPMQAYNAHSFDLAYTARYKRCRKIVKLVNHKAITCIRTKIVNSHNEAKEFYRFIREMGGEGAILKNFNMKWKFNTSTESIKLKNVIDFELKLVDWKKGKKGTRFENCMGALICESECEKLQVSIGTGFSDKEREKNWGNEIGNILTISCESIIKDKSKELYSLYLPRFVELRLDRNTAQTLKDMQNR
ncbi:MAG: ATP-dependent DNA ligase, partial [Candidatus Heimdallarchaeota archaeon]